MHILTSLLITGLLHRRKKKSAEKKAESDQEESRFSSPLLKMPSVLSVVHSIPGRTRFRVPMLVGMTSASQKLRKTLLGIEGVEDVDVNIVSGTILVKHNPKRVFPDVLAAALIRLLGLEKQIYGDVEAKFARELRELARAMNRAIYEQTGGMLDMKTILFLALAGLGVQQLVRRRSIALSAGFTLLWWAVNGLMSGRQNDS